MQGFKTWKVKSPAVPRPQGGGGYEGLVYDYWDLYWEKRRGANKTCVNNLRHIAVAFSDVRNVMTSFNNVRMTYFHIILRRKLLSLKYYNLKLALGVDEQVM